MCDESSSDLIALGLLSRLVPHPFGSWLGKVGSVRKDKGLEITADGVPIHKQDCTDAFLCHLAKASYRKGRVRVV